MVHASSASISDGRRGCDESMLFSLKRLRSGEADRPLAGAGVGYDRRLAAMRSDAVVKRPHFSPPIRFSLLHAARCRVVVAGGLRSR